MKKAIEYFTECLRRHCLQHVLSANLIVQSAHHGPCDQNHVSLCKSTLYPVSWTCCFCVYSHFFIVYCVLDINHLFLYATPYYILCPEHLSLYNFILYTVSWTPVALYSSVLRPLSWACVICVFIQIHTISYVLDMSRLCL